MRKSYLELDGSIVGGGERLQPADDAGVLSPAAGLLSVPVVVVARVQYRLPKCDLCGNVSNG